MSASEATASARAALHASLIEFSDSPGKFPVLQREPAILFRSIREILQLAGGRGVPDTENGASRIRHAAGVFIRAALLRDGADHYALLGVDATADDQLIKGQYRLLMRLIHPDFSAAHAVTWPPDAATRVNLAYNVLSSPVSRREYDEQLAAARRLSTGGAAGIKGSSVDGQPGRTPGNHVLANRRDALQRNRLRNVVALCGLAGIGLTIYIVSTLDRGHQVYLVQRNAGSAEVVNPKRPIAAEATAEMIALQSLLPDDRDSSAVPGRSAALPTETRQPITDKLPTRPSLVRPASSPVLRPSGPVFPRATEAVAKAGKREAPQSPASRASESDESKSEMPESAAPNPGNSESPSSSASAARNVTPTTATATATATVTTAGKSVFSAEHVESGLVLRAAVKADMGIQASPPKEKVVIPAVTVSEAQPVLNNLLIQLESGRGINLLALMDKDARKEPSAIAFASYYDAFVGGSRTVRLSQVSLKPETGTGRLQMAGFVRVDLMDEGPRSKRLALRVEFGSRGGAVVVTRLTGSEVVDR